MRDIQLNVTFDIDQDTQLLRWVFLANGEPITGQGTETGLLAFQIDDRLSVTVAATSENLIDKVRIDGCHFITLPRVFSKRENPDRAGEFPEPSPFNEYGAVIDLGSGECTGHIPGKIKTWQSDVPLQCDNLGRWELSFIITTTIFRKNGDLIIPEQRVFAFDPEVEVNDGNG